MHTPARTRTRTHTHTHTHTHTLTHTHTHAHTTHTCTPTPTHTYTHTYTYTQCQVHAKIHIDTYAITHMGVHTRTRKQDSLLQREAAPLTLLHTPEQSQLTPSGPIVRLPLSWPRHFQNTMSRITLKSKILLKWMDGDGRTKC